MENLKRNFLGVLLLIFVITMSCNKEKPVADSDGLQFSPPRAGTPTTRPRLISSNGSASGRVSDVVVSNQLFAFSGNNLYRIQTDNATYTLIGVDWGGTEAAQAIGEDLFAVQGDHLWKCNLRNETCIDLGAAWSGTTFLTGSVDLYGVQGGAIWKVNTTNGQWARLGSNNWNFVTEFAYIDDYPGNLIVSEGTSYLLQPPPFWQTLGTWRIPGSGVRRRISDKKIKPYTIPSPPQFSVDFFADNQYYATPGLFGVYRGANEDNGRIVRSYLYSDYYEVVSLKDPSNPELGKDWTNATDIAWTRYTRSNVPRSKSIWILKDGLIYRLKQAEASTLYTGNVIVNPQGAVYETVNGLTGVYKITSNQAR